MYVYSNQINMKFFPDFCELLVKMIQTEFAKDTKMMGIKKQFEKTTQLPNVLWVSAVKI